MFRKPIIIKGLISLLTIVVVTSNVYADDLKGRISIGLGNPYISIKHGISHKYSIEVRGYFDSGIQVYGGRFYYNFNLRDRTVIFTGGEGDYIFFDVDDVKGSGYMVYGFIGGEYFITKKFTLIADIGPTFIGLKENDFDLAVNGIEWIFNLGINLYFGNKEIGGKKR